MVEEVIDELVMPMVYLDPEEEEKKKNGTTIDDYDDSVTDRDLPPKIEYGEISVFAPEKRSLILDIETTATLPTEGRIFSIGVKDASKSEETPTVFIDADEKTLIEEFFAFYVAGRFNELIGYNVSFDLRYLFAAAMRYRLSCPELFNSDLYDLMQIMKQVKPAFVYGMNKPGKLEQWAFYLFGMKKTMDYKTLQQAWREEDIESVFTYSGNDVDMTFKLWSLVQAAYGKPAMIPAAPVETESLENPATPNIKQCSSCLANNEVKEGTTLFTCANCGAINKV